MIYHILSYRMALHYVISCHMLWYGLYDMMYSILIIPCYTISYHIRLYYSMYGASGGVCLPYRCTFFILRSFMLRSFEWSAFSGVLVYVWIVHPLCVSTTTQTSCLVVQHFGFLQYPMRTQNALSQRKLWHSCSNTFSSNRVYHYWSRGTRYRSVHAFSGTTLHERAVTQQRVGIPCRSHLRALSKLVELACY